MTQHTTRQSSTIQNLNSYVLVKIRILTRLTEFEETLTVINYN